MIETVGTPGLWAGFIALVLALLALDLGVFNRKDHVIQVREAISWTLVWVAVSLAFNAWVWWEFGAVKGTEFLTGYLIEKSLSVDNLFVFIVVFATFRVPAHLQHRVLFWGIVTALVLRGLMIWGGTALLQRFHALIYVFGAFLLLTGVKIMFHAEKEHHPEQGLAFRLLRRIVPATTRLDGHRFFVVEAGRRVATPLFLALCLIEISDVVFALDSIPAIFGVTLDPFIVFTSNIFAILGLRSLYFAVAAWLGRFEYLKIGLSLVLVFIGVKMVGAHWYKVPTTVSLGVVVALLGGATVFSLMKTRNAAAAEARAAAPVERES